MWINAYLKVTYLCLDLIGSEHFSGAADDKHFGWRKNITADCVFVTIVINVQSHNAHHFTCTICNKVLTKSLLTADILTNYSLHITHKQAA